MTIASRTRVMVTGMGAVAPTGATLDEFWSNCCAGVTRVEPIPAAWRSYFDPGCAIWAPLPPLACEAYPISRIERMQLDTTALLAIAAADQALTQARVERRLVDEKRNAYALEGFDAARCGVYLGTGIGGIASFAANQGHHLYEPVKRHLGTPPGGGPDFLRCPQRFHPFAVSMSMPNGAAAATGIKYSLHGPVVTTSCACAAGTAAIGAAFEALRAGRVDAALAGGVEYVNDGYGGIFRGFDIAKALARDADPRTANRPFDKKRTGFLLAEGGCAVLLLESEDHARRRGAACLAELRGFAESFDAHSMMSIEPGGETIERMLRELLDATSLRPADVSYINSHGTGTAVNDEVESAVVERLFGARVPINATKSLIGHTIGAAGALEAAVTVMSIVKQTVHGCRNLDEPVRPLNFIRQTAAREIDNALTHSFAFGGHNAALLFSRSSPSS